jgi:hypothetical protein
MDERAFCERLDNPAWSENLACTQTPCLGTGRSSGRPSRKGPCREGVRAEADDERSGELRPLHCSGEVGEQTRAA